MKGKKILSAGVAAGLTVITFGSILLGGAFHKTVEEDPLLIVDEADVPLAATPQDVSTQMGYAFHTQGVDIVMDAPALPMIAKLGTPLSYSESTESMYGEKDSTYQYDGYEIATYTLGDVDYVSAVFITDENIKTPEGLSIAMSKDDMEEIYGKDYLEEDGIYTYQKNGMGLEFMIDDDEIVYIQYLSSIYM